MLICSWCFLEGEVEVDPTVSPPSCQSQKCSYKLLDLEETQKEGRNHERLSDLP